MTLYAKWAKKQVPPNVTIAKGSTYRKATDWGDSSKRLAFVETTLKFSKAGTYTIEHDLRSGSNKKMSKVFKRTVKAGETVPISLIFTLYNKKVGSCNYYLKITDSSSKTQHLKSYKIPWHLSDIGTDMSVEN